MCTGVHQYLCSVSKGERDQGGVEVVQVLRTFNGTTYESADGVSDALPSRTSFRNTDISWGGAPGAGPALDWSASPPFCVWCACGALASEYGTPLSRFTLAQQRRRGSTAPMPRRTNAEGGRASSGEAIRRAVEDEVRMSTVEVRLWGNGSGGRIGGMQE